MTPRPAQTLSLKGRALRYLAAREHSRAELATKLSRHVGPEDDPDAVARVAESVLHRRAGRLGGARVLQELRAKGLPDDVVADAAAQLRSTELARAQAVWRRKFGQPPADAAERARQLRFLAARGFSGDVARRALGGAADDDDF